MYNHRDGAGRARNWKGELNGKRRPDRDEYNCSTYNLSSQSYDKQCSQHYIRTEVVRRRVLETIKAVSDYVITNEEEFINRIYSTSRDKQKESIRSLKRKIAQDLYHHLLDKWKFCWIVDKALAHFEKAFQQIQTE